MCPETMTPEFAARELLYTLHIDSVPTPVEEICSQLEIVVERTDEIDAEALLIADGQGEVMILLNQKIRSLGRQNFTLAHELGHFRLPHHARRYSCSWADINHFSAEKPLETEANVFASELLFAEKPFLSDLRCMELSWKAISKLANRYQASMTATALRVCKKTTDSCAIAFIQAGKVKWACESQSFRGRIVRGAVPARSMVAMQADAIDIASGMVPSGVWIPGRCPFQELRESLFPLPSIEAWLVLLDPGDEEYETWFDGDGIE